MTEFSMHPQLEADCLLVTDLDLCRCLLMNDRRFPWLILVPRLPALRDLHDVPRAHRMALFDEIDSASSALQVCRDAYKINVAALGNQVPQLHVHVIARFQNDAAWPAPVWGSGPAEPYAGEAAAQLLTQLRAAL